MKNHQLTAEQVAQKLTKEQIIEKLKQKNLKGGNNGHGCPPPCW